MTIFKKLLAVAVVAGGFTFAAGTDSAEAGYHGGHYGYNSHYGHGYGHQYRSFKPYYSHYDYDYGYQPYVFKKYWCDIHGCYYYFDRFGHKRFIR